MKDILLAIKNWLIHKFEVHCAECEQEYRCLVCENKDKEIDFLKTVNQRLMDDLLNRNKPIVEDEVNEKEDYKPIGKQYVSWPMRRQQLELADRELARAQRNKVTDIDNSKKTTEQLEKEVLLGDEAVAK